MLHVTFILRTTRLDLRGKSVRNSGKTVRRIYFNIFPLKEDSNWGPPRFTETGILPIDLMLTLLSASFHISYNIYIYIYM